MEIFAEYLTRIEDPQHRAQLEDVLDWITKNFPNLVPVLKWNHPMFTDHGTFIIGFSVAKHHMSVTPEGTGIVHFSEEIVQAGYDHGKMIMRMPWDRPFNYELLEKIIAFNIADKANCTTFWRK